MIEQRVLLSIVTWNVTTSGNWDNPANWVDDQGVHRVLGTGDDVVINAPSGNPTVTIRSGDTISVNSLSGRDPLSLSGGSLSISTTATLGAALTLSGGALALGGASSAASLAMSGGTLSGSGTLTVSGATTWTGGTMSGSGTTNAQGGLTLGGTTAFTQYDEFLTGWTLNNSGVATLEGTSFSSGLYLDSGAVLDNEPGASFDVIADYSPIWANGGTPGGGTVNNQGTFAKTAGSGASAAWRKWTGGFPTSSSPLNEGGVWGGAWCRTLPAWRPEPPLTPPS